MTCVRACVCVWACAWVCGHVCVCVCVWVYVKHARRTRVPNFSQKKRKKSSSVRDGLVQLCLLLLKQLQLQLQLQQQQQQQQHNSPFRGRKKKPMGNHRQQQQQRRHNGYRNENQSRTSRRICDYKKKRGRLYPHFLFFQGSVFVVFFSPVAAWRCFALLFFHAGS